MDLGACWVHSYRKANPLHKYIMKFGVKHAVLAKRTCGREFFDGETLQCFDEQTMEYAHFNQSQFFRNAEQTVAKSEKEDLSLYEAAGEEFDKKWEMMGPAERRCTQMLINMTEHY